MDEENNSVSFTTKNLNVKEQSMLEILRKERDDIIKQKIKNDSSMNIIQGTIKAQEEELKRVSESKSKLESEKAQLKEAAENEIHTKLKLENDVENMKRMTEMFAQQLAQLNNTLQVIEANTVNIGERKVSICKEIINYLSEQTLKEKYYQEEIMKMQTAVEAAVDKENKVNQERKLILDQQNEELSVLTKDEEEFMTLLQQEQNKNTQLENEIQNKKADKDNLEKEFAKLQHKFSEEKRIHNINKASREAEIKTLETNIEKDKESIENLKVKKEFLKQEHKKVNEENTQIESDLNNLDTEQCEKEEILTNLLDNLNEIKAKLSKQREEENAEIIFLQEKKKNVTEINERFQKSNKELQQKLEDKKETNEYLKEKLFTKNQKQEELIKQLEDTRKKNKENSSDYVITIKECKDLITDVQLRNKERKEATEDLKNEIKDKQKEISEMKDNIKNTTDKTNTIIQKKITVVKNLKEKLESAKKELQTSNFDLQKVIKSTEEERKSSEKNYRDKINKIEKEMKQFQEKMDTIMKNDKDKYIKDKKSLDDSNKTMILKINELKNSKENLQGEIAKKIEEILDATNKYEAKNNETQLKKSQSEIVFKSPKLPTKARKTRNTFATSTPKTILKKTPENPEKLIHKTEKEKQSLSPISENLDDSFDKEFPLTQKNINTDKISNFFENKNISLTQKPEIKKVDFVEAPIIKWQSLTVDSGRYKKPEDKKVEITAYQTNKWQSANPWSTDYSTSDDINISSTQLSKSQKYISPIQQMSKRPIYDVLDSEDTKKDSLKSTNNVATIKQSETKKIKLPLTQKTKVPWASENDSSDDSFFGKLDKSKKIQSKVKGTLNPPTTIILDTSTSD